MEKLSKIVCLTFDYELFLKETGTVENCLIKPTNALLDLFFRRKIRGTFFIDALYLNKIRYHNELLNDYKKVKQQLLRIIREGSRIELHLHPQWLSSDYKNGKWTFVELKKYYRLQNLTKEDVYASFKTGKDVLEDIAREVDSNYNIQAFRAGGYCISPFDKLKKPFLDLGLKIDSSIAPGLKYNSEFQDYDFRKVPTAPYYFTESPLSADPRGKIMEIPISVYKKFIYERVYEKLPHIKKPDKTIFGDGEGLIPKLGKDKNYFFHFLRKFNPLQFVLSLDNTSLHTFKKQLDRSESQIINVLSHPKLLSKTSLEIVRDLPDKNTDYLDIVSLYETIKIS